MITKTKSATEVFDVPASGGDLCVSRTGAGRKTVLALHGLAGSRVTMEQIARVLDLDEFTVLAVDLRGRGASCGLPPPYGMANHASDCAIVFDYFGVHRAVCVGHSMGALVVQHLAILRPEAVAGLVLIDGGIPTPLNLPKENITDSFIDSVVGPIMNNLRREFPSEDAFLDEWKAHPAWAGLWNDDIERRFRYDMTGEPPRVRSRASAEAVRADVVEALTTDIADSSAVFEKIHCPIHLIRATRGLLDQPTPMIPDQLVSEWRERLSNLTDTVVPDTNHVNIALLDRGLKVIAEKIRMCI